MSDLSEFLLAQFAKDEEVAQDADRIYPTTWAETLKRLDRYGMVREGRRAHIARHDPARVLAECEAKRRIVVRCQEMLTAAIPMAVHLAQQTLADLGRPYADRPDFRSEWKP